MIFRNGKLTPHDKDTLQSIRCEVGDVCVAIIDEEVPGHWERERFPNNVYRVRVIDSNWHSSIRRPERLRYTSRGSYRTMFEARNAVEKWYAGEGSSLHVRKNAPICCLPAGDGSSFYPTPPKLAGIMLSRVDWSKVRTVLEPSAGKGDLVEAVKSALADNEPGSRFYGKSDHRGLKFRDDLHQHMDIDVVEIDENLQQILIGKGFNLVHDDFLTYSTLKVYDLILMNPPFQNGDKHLLKAISMIEDIGGQIVCLLNAETIRNQYTNSRYMLAQRLSDLGARIEFFPNAFKRAERKTDVEIAMVTICIPTKKHESRIWEGMKKARTEAADSEDPSALVSGNWIEQMVAEYELEADAGVELLKEYGAMIPYIMSGGEEIYSAPLIRVSVGSEKEVKQVNTSVINEYLRRVRSKYWRMLLNRPEINRKMTSDMSKQYHAKLETLAGYGSR